MTLFNKFVELSKDLADKICKDSGTILANFEVEYEIFGDHDGYVNHILVERIKLVGFSDENEIGFSVDICESTKVEVLALIDKDNLTLLEEIEDSYCCGLDY